MLCYLRLAGVCLVSVCILFACACAGSLNGRLSYAAQVSDPLTNYSLSGDVTPVLDPSIIRERTTYYLFSTDVSGFPRNGSLPIHCSQDKVSWTLCGNVFPEGIPSWVKKKIPGIQGLWAPDISYFNGLYHVYYCGSTLGLNRTIIGEVVTPTLDSKDPAYQWIDRGLILESKPGDDFNALDPSIFVNADGTVWLTYGSYWSGIKQRQIDPKRGKLLSSNPTRYDLATRPGVPHNPIEGGTVTRHGDYYYLFVSMDYCCEATLAQDNYKQAVGRSKSPHGPFFDQTGTSMMRGGGTVLLKGNAAWNAPGGGTAYIDETGGESIIAFHAQNLSKDGVPFQWVKTLEWKDDWPVVGN